MTIQKMSIFKHIFSIFEYLEKRYIKLKYYYYYVCDLNECGRQCWGELLESRLLVGVCVQDEGDHALPLPLDIHRHGLRGGDTWGVTEADTTIE